MIYLDYAATTPCSKEILMIYSDLTHDYYYNHESLHVGGDTVQSLRQTADQYLNEVFTDNFTTIVTTSGSEGNRIAIDLYLQDRMNPRVLLSPLEHPSIFAALEVYDASITWLPMRNGQVDLQAAAHLIKEMDLVIMQHTHSETGLLMPVEAIADLCLKYQVPFHCDIVQAAGKFLINTNGMTSYSFTSHKFYGLKGIGALRIRPEYVHLLNPHFHHEYGTKNGTLDIPAYAAMTYLLKNSILYIEERHQKVSELKKQLLQGLNSSYSTVPYEMSPYIVPLISHQYEGQYIMQRLSQQDILISTGTACGHGIIHSLGLETLLGKSINQYFRVSLSHLTTHQEIEQLVTALNAISEEYNDTPTTTADR